MAVLASPWCGKNSRNALLPCSQFFLNCFIQAYSAWQFAQVQQGLGLAKSLHLSHGKYVIIWSWEATERHPQRSLGGDNPCFLACNKQPAFQVGQALWHWHQTKASVFCAFAFLKAPKSNAVLCFAVVTPLLSRLLLERRSLKNFISSCLLVSVRKRQKITASSVSTLWHSVLTVKFAVSI